MSDDEYRILGEVIDRWRLNLGWTPLDTQSHKMACDSWFSILTTEDVPHTAYHELYNRAIKTRALKLANGKDISMQFGVELLLAEWEVLRKELHEKANEYVPQQLNAYYPSPQQIEKEVGQNFDDWFAEQVNKGKEKMRAKLGND